MELSWNNYVSLKDEKLKKEEWEGVLMRFLNGLDEAVDNDCLKDFVHHLGKEFLSSIEEHCRLFEDEPQKLLDYLSQRQGLLMLLNLTFYGDRISSCAYDLCNLLLSLIPLFANVDITDESLDVVPANVEINELKSYLQSNICQYAGLRKATYDENCSSSDDESQSTCQPTQLDTLHLDSKQLFNTIIAAVVTLVQSDDTLKESSSFFPYVDSCLTILNQLKTDSTKSFIIHGNLHIIFVMFNEILNFKDTVHNISSLTTQLFNFASTFQTSISIGSALLFSCFFKMLLSCFLCNLNSLKGQISSMSPEMSNLLLPIISGCHFDNIKHFAKNLQIHLQESNTSEYGKLAVNNLEMIFNAMLTLSKSTKGMKQWCCENNRSSKPDLRFAGKRRFSKRNDTMSSDEDYPIPSCKTDEISDDESGTEDLSDFERFSKSSDSHDRKSQTSKSEVSRKGEKVCMVAYFLKLFVNILKETEEEKIADSTLRSLVNLSICPCISIDHYLNDVLSCLSKSHIHIKEKVLFLVSHVLITNQDTLLQKKVTPSSTSSSSLNRTTPRSQSSLESGGFDGIEFDPKKMEFLFIGQLMNYLLQNDNMELKIAIMKHLKFLSLKLSSSCHIELFHKMYLSLFSKMFPVECGTHNNDMFTFSDDEDFLCICIQVIQISMQKSNDFLFKFYDTFSIEILKTLASSNYKKVGIEAIHVLEYLISAANESCKTYVKMKSKVKHKDLEDICREATVLLLEILNALIIQAIESNIFTEKENDECLVKMLLIVNRLLPHRKYFQNEFKKLSLNYKSIQLFDKLISEMKEQLQENMNNESIEYFLKWLKILLPSCLNNLNKEAHSNIFEQVQTSFLDRLANHPDYCKDALLTLLRASTIQQEQRLATDDVLNDELFIEFKSPVRGNFDEEKTKQKYPFGDDYGYEADGESDNTEEKNHFRNRETSFSKKIVAPSNIEKLDSPVIFHKHLCCFVLNFINEYFPSQNDEKWCDLLTSIMQEIYMYQRGAIKNNFILSKLGILSIIFKDFKFVFKNDFSQDVQAIVEKVILCLCCEEITALQLKYFLQLFKDKENDFKYLTSLFWKITEISIKSLGPSNFLRFPSFFSDDRPKIFPTSMQRTQTFMIPKQDLNPRKFKNRSHSWSSRYEIDGQRYIPLGFSNQPAAKDLSLVSLPLESKFMWPDKDFSISLWFCLEDTNTAMEVLLAFDKTRQTFYRCLSSNSSVRFENEFEELLHLCSFGASNAMFEVWLGARTGSIHYRWIISNYGNTHPDIEYTPFEQVNVPQQVMLNKWHHIVVSLSATSQKSTGLPHTTEVFTYLDGCQLETMQMKYPTKSLQSKATLVALLGHGLNKSDENKHFASDRHLKIGNLLIFQGETSFNEKRDVKNADPVVDKFKAIYLYTLGPDNTNINTEYFGFMNYKSSHIDSSLSWDSIMFKEFSFCVNILSEELINNQFPASEFFGKNQMSLLMNMRHELQTHLLLAYNPKHYGQFYQYIPQLRMSGQIQHIYITDVSNESKPGLIEGTAIDVKLSGQIYCNTSNTLQTAVSQCGGMPVLLYLYALIAERESCESALSNVIKVLFALQSSCLFLLREMNDCTGYVLFNEAMRLSPCKLSIPIMKSLMESICEGDVFLPSTDPQDVSININSTAIVRNICLLQSLLKDWHLLLNESFCVQETMWKVLDVLVRPTHPYQKFNILQYQRARIVENMLIGCQEWKEEKPNEVIPESMCKIYLSVISNLLGQPIDLQVFHSISNFLIAIHPTFDTVTLHSPHRFYLYHKPLPASILNVPLRDKSKMVPNRSRRTASFTEGLNTYQPRVILSQEDLTSGTIIQSEVIIRRPSYASRLPKFPPDSITSDNEKHLQSIEKFFDSVDGNPTIATQPMSSCSPRLPLHKKINTHRRIQSDGNIRFNTTVELPKLKPKPPLISTESTDYDVISDSEVVSSCEEEPEDYLVVDGFIDQTVESFTPTTNEKEASTETDVLYHMRYGLMKLVQSTLAILPDSLVTRVIGKILKIEILLVLVNQKSDKIREVALENLYLYLQRGGRDCFENFKRFMGCHLLANELHQYPITQKIIEHCLSLLFMHPIKFDKDILFTIDSYESDSLCPATVVPCLTLLEGCVQKPTTFGLLSQCLIKIFNRYQEVMCMAFENGFVHILNNIVANLSNEMTGSMNIGWKKETFSHFIGLVNWFISISCCTYDAKHYHHFKNFLVLIQKAEQKSKDQAGVSNNTLFKVSRFLCYHLMQKSLLVFQSKNFFEDTISGSHMKRDEDYCSSSQEFSKTSSMTSRQQAARSFFKKIPSSFHFVQPSLNIPSEIHEQFTDVMSEAVRLAVMYSRNEMVSDTVFGYKLEYLLKDELEQFSDAHQQYCSDLMHWFFHSLAKTQTYKVNECYWAVLLHSAKEKLIAIATQLVLHVISPLRSKDMRFIYLKEVLTFKDNKHVLQLLLYDLALSKTQFLPCINNMKHLPEVTMTDEENSIIKEFKDLTSKIPTTKTTDQKLSEEIREVRHRKREEENFKLTEAYNKLSKQRDELQSRIAAQGNEMTSVIVEGQDLQRQNLLRVKRGKQSKHMEARKTWRNLIHHLTQERAPWHLESLYPKSWQLDPTEGPLRMRKRLQRCHLEIPSRFFLDSAPGIVPVCDTCHLSYLFDQNGEEQGASYSFRTNDTIREMKPCIRVSPGSKTAGEILIGGTHMYFVEEETLESDKNTTQTYFGDHDVISFSWRYEEIREILKRRYSLRDYALEIFLTSGRTFLLAFKDTKSRDDIYNQLVSKELSNLVTNSLDLNTLTQRWRNGAITNFEYLTELNKKAGRSFNDLMQYPVFPFILSDYESDVLNLRSSASYRNLSRPIACQDKSKEERYIEMYNYLKKEYEQRKQTDPEEAVPPYHYSSHYSNSGTILHFLVRLPPFTSMFLKYQDNQFDIPDRTFHSMSTTWKLSSFVSSTDVKELIPEFFFLEEFLMNGERFDMGVRQSKERVDDVILPQWCQNDSRLFTLIHMQALESDEVSSNLHHWIDLVFGCKQTGNAAIKATNVFHPSTYFGVDVDAIKDEIHRRALQTMIETYGQTPLQLFSSAHPKRFSKNMITPAFIDIIPHSMESMIATARSEKSNRTQSSEGTALNPLNSVSGVQWGDYCGSPTHQPPVVMWIQTFPFCAYNIFTSRTDLSAYLCAKHTCILANHSLSAVRKTIGVLQWGFHDNLLRINLLHSDMKTLFHPMRPDKVTCCVFVPGVNILFVGGTSGVLNVWPVQFSVNKACLNVIGPKQNLLGHDNEISSIYVSQAYSVIVTISKDQTAIIWDLNRLCYIRSLEKHESAVKCVSISEVSGDIATACNKNKEAIIYLWTINGKRVGRISMQGHVNCVTFSNLPDGTAVNVIAAGFKDGSIRMWDTWTLKSLRCIQANANQESIIALSFSAWNSLHLISTDENGNVYLWTVKDLVLTKPPSFTLVSPNV